MLPHSVANLNNGIPMCEWLGPGPRQIMSSEKKGGGGRNHAWDGKGGNGNAAQLVLAAARGGNE